MVERGVLDWLENLSLTVETSARTVSGKDDRSCGFTNATSLQVRPEDSFLSLPDIATEHLCIGQFPLRTKLLLLDKEENWWGINPHLDGKRGNAFRDGWRSGIFFGWIWSWCIEIEVNSGAVVCGTALLPESSWFMSPVRLENSFGLGKLVLTCLACKNSTAISERSEVDGPLLQVEDRFWREKTIASWVGRRKRSQEGEKSFHHFPVNPLHQL